VHHPWRRFAQLTAWRLRFDDLPPGRYGQTCHRTRTVTLARGLSQAERRCTIAHETQHVLRGPVPPHLRLVEELAVDRAVARLLMPDLHRVADALAWAGNDREVAADELWVDDLLLDVRLVAMSPPERALLARRLAIGTP
jgi:hypothetical protein